MAKLLGNFWAYLTLTWFTFFHADTYGQSSLDGYIREGLANNLVIRQKNLTLQQAQQSLQIARSYFLPSVSLLGDYLSAEGGRNIAIPVGDLLNPVYSTLNQLIGNPAFPTIGNVKQNFLPKNFYDVRLRTSVPLINTDLYGNRAIQSQQIRMKQYELEVYKRELVAMIKTAYFHYLAATQAVRIYESARLLVNKNVEVNASLLRNGKGLSANYLRSKSEAEKITAELNGARNKQTNARKYINFLLNKPLDTEVDETFSQGEPTLLDTASAHTGNREELLIIQTAKEINESQMRMSKLARLPKVNAFLDLGSQAYDWRYNEQSRYYLLGIQLTVPLFQGFRNTMQIRQNGLELEKTGLNLTYTQNQLQMAAEVAGNELVTASRNYLASRGQLTSAQSYFTLIEKGYQQGVNSLIEYLDARNQLTSSQLQQLIRWFEMRMAEARLERETASYSFEKDLP
ncbi:TolC family protein [Larkinella terrae]|nr:TolC family protein [Larkinella terrae]